MTLWLSQAWQSSAEDLCRHEFGRLGGFSHQVLHCKLQLYFSQDSAHPPPQLFNCTTLWKAGQVESGTGGQGKRETKVWSLAGSKSWPPPRWWYSRNYQCINLFAALYGSCLLSKNIPTVHQVKVSFRGSAESMMNKCYYICMESVNINGHFAVRLFNIQREKDSGGREVNCYI